MIYDVKKHFKSPMRLIVAVFVLGENMVVRGKDVLKLCLGLWWEVFEKSALSGIWTLLKVGL